MPKIIAAIAFALAVSGCTNNFSASATGENIEPLKHAMHGYSAYFPTY